MFTSCGVKSPPLTYPDTVVESYLKDFYSQNNQSKTIELKETKENTDETLKQTTP